MRFELSYRDGGNVRDGEYIFTYNDECVHCGLESGRGFFIIDRLNEPRISYVCLGCIYDFLISSGETIESKQDIGFLNIDLPRRYANFYMGWRQNRIPDNIFTQHKYILGKYLHYYFIEAIEQLVELDIDYIRNHHKGSDWQGFWLKLSGKELMNGLYLLKNALDSNCLPSDKFKQMNPKTKYPCYVNIMDDVFKKFKG